MIDNELRALGALLISRNVEELRDAHWAARDQSDIGRCIHHAVRVLESKDLDVDVITVFEFVRDSRRLQEECPNASGAVTLELLNECVINAMPADQALAYFREFEQVHDDLADDADWISAQELAFQKGAL